MNSRERVDAVLGGRKADRLPVHHLGFSSDVASALLGREAYVGGGVQQWREARALWQGGEAHQEFLERSFRDAIDIASECEHDIVRVSYWRFRLKPARRIDEYTFLYEQGGEDSARVLRYDPGSEQCAIFDVRPQAELALEDLEGHVQAQEETNSGYQPDTDQYAFEIRAQKLLGHDFVVRVGAGHIAIPTDPAWLEATILRPDLVGRLLDVQVERARRDFAFLSRYGFGWFFGGGDLAYNDGLLYSARTFRELLLPRLQRMAEAAHECGGRLLFCSDGNLWQVADELFHASGVDGYCEIDRVAGMDLRELRRRYPRLGLIGNIASHTVHLGTTEQVATQTLACVEEAKICGGVVVGVSNYFVPHTPIENVRAVLDTIRQYR